MPGSRVIVKFKDALIDTHMPDAADLFLKTPPVNTYWTQLAALPQFQCIAIRKLVTSISQAELLNLRDQAFRLNPDYSHFAPNFLSFFSIVCPPNINPDQVVQVLSSPPWQNLVQLAYVSGVPSPPPLISNPTTNVDWIRPDTYFLRAAPAGIDANYAWGLTGGDGGDGANLKFVDIESDWAFPLPPDIPGTITKIYGERVNYQPNLALPSTREHGTRILGIVIAQNNSTLSLGVAPNVGAIMVASHWMPGTPTPPPGQSPDPAYFDFINALAFAAANTQPGDVVLLEIQFQNAAGTLYNLPVEYQYDHFHYIQLLTNNHRVVVEAAGNNNYDLDSLGVQWLRRDPDNDSGAILVSAATPWINYPDYVHAPIVVNSVRQHNYGNRIDCYAWGDNIYTTSQSAPGYATAGDTSGAAAIIAGAALSVQGIAKVHLGSYLPPPQLRSYLSNPTAGTRSATPLSDKIGVMPNLRAIIAELGIDGNPPDAPRNLKVK